MFFGEPKHYLFKAPMETAEQIARLTWSSLCHHVKHFFPQAWLPEVEEIALFQICIWRSPVAAFAAVSGHGAERVAGLIE